MLERLSDCDAVEAVSMDMSHSFREAVQLCLPRARIVADHFHVIQHIGTALKQAQLDAWIARVKQDGPTPLHKALSAFRDWRQEILAFFDFLPTRLSNGFVEGKNNRTKALMRQGYGSANRRHLRLRILLGVAS